MVDLHERILMPSNTHPFFPMFFCSTRASDATASPDENEPKHPNRTRKERHGTYHEPGTQAPSVEHSAVRDGHVENDRAVAHGCGVDAFLARQRQPENPRTNRFAKCVGYDRHQWCFHERRDHFFGARVDGHAIVLGAVVLVWVVRRVWFGVGGAARSDRVTRGTWCVKFLFGRIIFPISKMLFPKNVVSKNVF